MFMSVDIPDDWVRADKQKFQVLLNQLNYKMDDFGFFTFVHNGQRFAYRKIDQTIMVDPQYFDDD